MARLVQVVLHSHFEREVAVPASSEVLCHIHRISADQSVNLGYRLFCGFSVDVGYYRRQKVREDSLVAVFCPRYVIVRSWWDQ